VKTGSLSFRLLLSAGFILAAFFAIVAVVLEQGFRKSAEQALEEKLQVQIYSLLSAAELTQNAQLRMPSNLHEPRYTHPGSGLYAFIQQADHKLIWRSDSAVGVDAVAAPELAPGSFAFVLDDAGRYVLHYDVIWEHEAGLENEYIFSVAEDFQFVTNQVARFRKTLRTWLFATGLILVLIQFIILRWSLKPLRTIGKDLAAIEHGEKTRLEGAYPTELQGLAGNLNKLVGSERAHLERYRNTLVDLAHSLKTPLAILRGCQQLPGLPVNIKETLRQQILRMDEIVEYQLQRAAAKGQNKLVGRVDTAVVINKIAASLQKVYADKDVQIKFNLHGSSLVYCEEGDFYEIAGNLMDNACKWCRHRVLVTLQGGDGLASGFALRLEVEDDGDGILPDRVHEILQRGARADENIAGHGIGMAVVNDIVTLLGGELQVKKSKSLGGMQWIVNLP
jgi:two-component system, OmpR family, sensor histidine kinase PhoQ